ncbi:hypothetical protein ILUMI_22125 [Ignelater luminosus]|uniref:Uncharacterized protein n=1 Tax=Ignelater luminosus TaxID=2038154 RepID=A0A8K0G0S5_IGNLU|nr:hypothetical protein ILUMI_22125 [Ignelater luminosus]
MWCLEHDQQIGAIQPEMLNNAAYNLDERVTCSEAEQTLEGRLSMYGDIELVLEIPCVIEAGSQITLESSQSENEVNVEKKKCEKCLLGFIPLTDVTDQSLLLYNLCEIKENISRERQEGRNKMIEAAQNMLSSSTRKIPSFKEDDCVLLSVP